VSDLPPIFGDSGAGDDRRQPQIAYPTQWSYHVIGADLDALRVAVIDAVGSAPHEWEGGAESRHGNWHSLRVRVRVEDEAHRLGILEAMQGHEAIRLVL